MKKKFLSVLAVACVACLSAALLAGCSQQQSSSNDGNPADNKLIVGFDNSYPPYGFMDENNNPTGFDLDLAQGSSPTVTVGTSSFLPSIGIPRMLS